MSPARPLVAVARVESSVRDAVRQAMEWAGWRDAIPAGSKIAVKPNLCWDLPLPGAQTSPWVLDAVLEVLLTRVSDVVVVEAGQLTVNADVALRTCGLDRVLAKHGVPFINMSRGAFHEATLPDAAVLRHLELPEVLRDRALVTLPVLKTHATTTITGSLKNQWGCLRELRHNHHLVVDEAISDLNRLVRPVLSIMDGTVGLEGNGPKTGRPRIADLVLASADPVALDSTAARIMGFDPASIRHLVLAEANGLGASARDAIEVRGVDIDRIDLGFRPPKPGLIPRTEFALRRSALKQLAFDTPVLAALGSAAKIYNGAWYLASGWRARRRVIRGSRYGAQWLGQDESSVEATGE